MHRPQSINSFDRPAELQMHTQRPRRSPPAGAPSARLSRLASVSLLALLLAACAASARPLNHNQVKFRRVPSKEFRAALGSSITIECEAGASPPPTIHWLRNGKRIPQSDHDDENQLDDLGRPGALQADDVQRIALSATRSRLFIDCADLADEATYSCVAENPNSRVVTHTSLTLIRPAASLPLGEDQGSLAAVPQCLGQAAAVASAQRSARQAEAEGNGAARAQAELQVAAALAQAAPPLRIHMWTHNIIEVMKNDVILYCRSNIKRPLEAAEQQAAKADAPLDQQQRRPQLSWSLPDDKPVTSDLRDKYEVLDSGDLLIKDLRWADMGSYVCTVSDDAGSDSVSTFVYPAASKVSGGKRSVKLVDGGAGQRLLGAFG